MKGQRLPDGYNYGVNEGDYFRDPDGMWTLRPPRSDVGFLDGHTVSEHEDGTITVEPSIVTPHWHGYLRHGEWSEA